MVKEVAVPRKGLLKGSATTVSPLTLLSAAAACLGLYVATVLIIVSVTAWFLLAIISDVH